MDARSPEPASTARPPVAAAELVAAGGLLAFGTAFLLSPAGVEGGTVLCPFRRLTGLECPACGLTRSWVRLAHGDLTSSLSANPFGPVLLLGVVVLVVLVVRARRRDGPAPVLELLARRPAVLAVGVLWGAFGLVRMTA